MATADGRTVDVTLVALSLEERRRVWGLLAAYGPEDTCRRLAVDPDLLEQACTTGVASGYLAAIRQRLA
jgi:hypothetical protein